MDPILDPIDEALARKGLSDAAASKLAVGHPSLLKNLRMPREGEKRYNLPALMKLAEVLDLEFYFGPRRSIGRVQVIDQAEEYAHIPLHSACLSAGHGTINEAEEIVGALAFRREWLRRVGVDASRAALARASGESMEPSIFDGDMLLLDLTRINPPPLAKNERGARKSPIFAVLDDGEAKVKRVHLTDQGTAVLMSDNPDYPPTFVRIETLQIIGKVVWWGHTQSD